MEAEAASNNRSMNAEIVARLERSLKQDEDKIETAARALVAGLDDAIIDRIVEIIEEDRREADYDAYSDELNRRKEEEAELAKQDKENESK
jgi:hypothetical protein